MRNVETPMAAKRDFYEILGVSRSATEGEISDAYRELAMKYHPDRNPGDDEAVEKFKEAAEAFDVLSHRDKRTRYDRYGHAGVEGGATHFHDVNDIFGAFGDIFGDLFGGGRRRVHKGSDIRCQVSITLMEAAHGTEVDLNFKRHRACKMCGGSGAKPGTKPYNCRYCGGSGQIVQSTGIFSMQTTCPSCKGAGTIIKDPCSHCRGSGYVKEKVERKIGIPVGVDDQTRLRLSGEGEPSPDGGPPGDCYCFISVKKHPLFERDGQTLICQVPISYSQAALGATLEVPTLDGPEELIIGKGTQSGEVFRMSGRGIPSPRYKGRGDLLVQVHVEVATKLTPEHEETLRQLAEHEEAHVTPKRRNFFEKIKECFVTSSEEEVE